MAGFNDCIRLAQKQGALTEDEADTLIERYEAHRRANAGAGAADPDGAAKASLLAENEAKAAAKRAIATGQAAAQSRIRNFAETFRNLDGDKSAFDAFANLIESKAGGAASLKFRADARAFMAHAEVADFMSTFRRKFFSFTGKRANRPAVNEVGRAMMGEATNDPAAKALGDAMGGTLERLRQDFNKAAGFEAIGKLEGGWLPQDHDAAALLGVPGKTPDEKFALWRDHELPRLDLDKMKDPLTGDRLTPERLEETARAAWNNIVTGGWASHKPTAVRQGVGALATQRSEHRFFHYKSYDDWAASNREFGSGDPLKAMFQHIRSMSHDIETMNVFGPNPSATLEWMKQVVQSEAAKALIGQPSLHLGVPGKDTGKSRAARLEAIFSAVSGPDILSSRMANGFADASNVLTSAFLGSTSILAAATDPFIDMAARRLNGLPSTKALLGLAQAMHASQTREQMIRSGIGLDDFLHITGNEARYAGTLGGHQWSQTLADRTVTWNGLNALTQSRKHRFGSEWQGMTADSAGSTWSELATKNPYLRRAMENYGFSEKDWNALRKTDLYSPKEGSAGFLQPVDVKDRDLGIRYSAMILSEIERAVPSGSPRARSIVTSSLQRGTVWGEIANSGLQFKSFPMSFTASQYQAMKMELHMGAAQGAAYASSLFIPLTLGGGLAIQINNLVNFKDLQPMDPTTGQGFKFWLQAMFKGGGLGLLGDFIFSDLTRFGATPAEQLSGPTVTLASDALSLTVGNVQKALTGQKTHFGREAVRKISRNVPVISSHPFTRAAYQRMVVDQLQYLTDPEAHKYFREQEQKLRRETGQGFTWRPGEMTPDRLPELAEPRR